MMMVVMMMVLLAAFRYALRRRRLFPITLARCRGRRCSSDRRFVLGSLSRGLN